VDLLRVVGIDSFGSDIRKTEPGVVVSLVGDVVAEVDVACLVSPSGVSWFSSASGGLLPRALQSWRNRVRIILLLCIVLVLCVSLLGLACGVRV
jgi:hypothetical protein